MIIVKVKPAGIHCRLWYNNIILHDTVNVCVCVCVCVQLFLVSTAKSTRLCLTEMLCNEKRIKRNLLTGLVNI